MSKIKVLLVDDHAILRDGIRGLLGFCNDIEVVGEASEGQEAVNTVRQLVPDVVVIDIAMPGMDGLEATRLIKKRSPGTKVIILTQYDNKEYVTQVIKAGASGYVPKRALGSELVTAIRAVYQGDSYLYPSAARFLIDSFQQGANEKEPYDTLTPREREILKLVADGHTSREIANMLFVSLKTVLGHRLKLMKKLDLHNRSELVKYALRKGLISIDP